jgi:hypothetical protein
MGRGLELIVEALRKKRGLGLGLGLIGWFKSRGFGGIGWSATNSHRAGTLG